MEGREATKVWEISASYNVRHLKSKKRKKKSSGVVWAEASELPAWRVIGAIRKQWVPRKIKSTDCREDLERNQNVLGSKCAASEPSEGVCVTSSLLPDLYIGEETSFFSLIHFMGSHFGGRANWKSKHSRGNPWRDTLKPKYCSYIAHFPSFYVQ